MCSGVPRLFASDHCAVSASSCATQYLSGTWLKTWSSSSTAGPVVFTSDGKRGSDGAGHCGCDALAPRYERSAALVTAIAFRMPFSTKSTAALNDVNVDRESTATVTAPPWTVTAFVPYSTGPVALWWITASAIGSVGVKSSAAAGRVTVTLRGGWFVQRAQMWKSAVGPGKSSGAGASVIDSQAPAASIVRAGTVSANAFRRAVVVVPAAAHRHVEVAVTMPAGVRQPRADKRTLRRGSQTMHAFGVDLRQADEGAGDRERPRRDTGHAERAGQLPDRRGLHIHPPRGARVERRRRQARRERAQPASERHA